MESTWIFKNHKFSESLSHLVEKSLFFFTVDQQSSQQVSFYCCWWLFACLSTPLPNVTELISPALLHIGLDLLHPPTSLQVSKPLHPCPNRWQTIQCHSPRDGNKAAKELSQAGRQRGEPWRSPLEILKLGIRTTWIWILALTLIHYKTLDKLLNNSEPQFPSLEKGIMPGNAYYTAVVMIKWYT